MLPGPTDYPAIGAVATMTEALFKEVGLNVDFVATDFGTMISRRASQEPVEKGGWSTLCTAALGYQIADPISNNMIRGLGQAGWFGWPSSHHLQSPRDAWLDAPDLAAQQTVAAASSVQCSMRCRIFRPGSGSTRAPGAATSRGSSMGPHRCSGI